MNFLEAMEFKLKKDIQKLLGKFSYTSNLDLRFKDMSKIEEMVYISERLYKDLMDYANMINTDQKNKLKEVQK